uniref:Ig-like domain-containing protein n=1 Tax=Cyprinus carpio TaxID=7962 RepID=A0A8C1MFX7_CYPCA
MADKYDLCLLGLIILSSLLTGTSRAKVTHVFISTGENVHLSCSNAFRDCKSTTWNHNRFSNLTAVELIAGGIKKKDTESHERLSLGSDCSLNISNISKEDYGYYTCQQYVNGELQGNDTHVYLHVLHVSPSSSSSSSSASSQTEISAGLSVTLFCQLYSYDGVSCDDWIRSERIQLFWVNQAGVKLPRSDSRYQILLSSGHCIITLNTTLLNEDDNREWRCEVTQRDQVKTSVTYTVKSSAQADSATAVIPVHNTNSQDPSTANTHKAKVTFVIVIVMVGGVGTLAVLLPAIILWVIWNKITDNKKEDYDSSELTSVTYSGIPAENMSKRLIYSFKNSALVAGETRRQLLHHVQSNVYK